jgi:transcriptional regulator with XRE-family HTH domain
MTSFGELLSEYMTRTGISDSELARHLGVSRQTIFRWKEGLTARPRVREDVLRCAERLRLSASERDALLLAAGFAPEQSQMTDDRPQTTEIALHAQDGIVRAHALDVPRAARKNHRARWLITFAIGALVIGLALWLAANSPASQNFIALFITPTPTLVPAPTPTPLPPEFVIALARLNPRGGDAPAYDVTARLRQTLENEIANENLAPVRLVDVADSVRDADTAERVRERTGADVILWGNFSGDDARVELTHVARVPMTGTVLSAFPLLPRDQSVTLNMNTPAQTRALALLSVLPLQLARGNAATARRYQETAETLTPYSRDLRAALDFSRAYLRQTTAPLELDEALARYSRSLDVASPYEGYLNRGLAYLALNQTAAARADFANAQALDDVRPEASRAQCWLLALEQQPQAALPYCNDAVARDRTAWSLDARAVVYAQLGRYADAANEFANFLRWLDTQPANARGTFAPTRRAWIESLRAGKNPFDAETLNQLRGAP